MQRIKTFMPNGIPKNVRCYDNGGETADRYTVVFTGNYRRKGNFQYVGMNAAPFHPQGIGQHGESPRQIDTNKSGFAPAMGRKCHLGRRIPFADLPADCKLLVIQDYRSLWNLPSALEILALKLHPARFSDMSPKMANIVGYIIGQSWITPQINGLCTTSDGFVLASTTGDCGANHFLGSKDDLHRNWTGLLNAANDLASDERKLAESLFAQRVH